MECTKPGTIHEDELAAYVIGQPVRPGVIRHLASCSHCASLVMHYQKIERRLTQQLYRWDCPVSQELGEYHLGLLSAVDAHRIEVHLQQCILCTAEVQVLADFMAQDTFDLQSKQADKKLVEHVLVPAYTIAATVRRVVATLVPALPRIAVQRDAAGPALWPKNFVAEDLQISLQVENEVYQGQMSTVQLLGFVSQRGQSLEALQSIRVTLTAEHQHSTALPSDHCNQTSEQQIDELGNFVFTSITPATYLLELHLPDRVVVIESLGIGS